MMHLSRREFLQVAGIGMAGAVLAACQPQATPEAKVAEEPATTKPEAEEAPAAAEPVSIRFMWRLNDNENDFVDAGIAAFKNVKPEITVEPLYIDSAQFDVMYAAGDAPDALGTGPNSHTDQYVKKQIISLQDYASMVPGLMDDLYPVGTRGFTWEGKLYCLPQVLYYGGTFINKTLFEEAGVDLPPVDWNADGWSWTDAIEVAAKLTQDKDGDGRIDQYGINFGHWSPWSHTRYWGQDLVSDEDYKSGILRKFRFDEPDVYEACVNGLQARADLMLVDGVMPTPTVSTSLSEMGPMLKTGVVAMEVTGGWAVRGALPEEFKFAAAINPIGGKDGKGSRRNSVWTDPFKIVATTKYPDQCWDWIYWLAADPEGGVPIQTKMLGLTPAIASAFPDFLKTMEGRLDMTQTDLETFIKGCLETATTENVCHILVGMKATRPIQVAELDPCWAGERTAKEAVDAMEPLLKDQIRKTLQALNLS